MASTAFIQSFQLAVRNWPLWFGYTALNYVEGMIMNAIAPQGALVSSLAQGAVRTVEQEYFYAYKFAPQAADELKKYSTTSKKFTKTID